MAFDYDVPNNFFLKNYPPLDAYFKFIFLKIEKI